MTMRTADEVRAAAADKKLVEVERQFRRFFQEIDQQIDREITKNSANKSISYSVKQRHIDGTDFGRYLTEQGFNVRIDRVDNLNEAYVLIISW